MNRREWLIRTGAACSAFALGRVAAADEVPYVQTPQVVVDAMLTLAGVRGSDFLIDLGSGDGRIVITAAKRYGARGVGIDYDPYLVELGTRRAAAEGVADRVTFLKKDIFETDLAPASVVTMYLLPEVNLELRPRLLATLKPGTRVVSHDWDMGDWEPDAKLEVDAPDKPVGTLKQSTVYLWIIPARAEGRWRTRVPLPSGLAEVTLAIDQQFQSLSGTARIGERELEIERAFVRGPHVFFRFGEGAEQVRFQGQLFTDRMVGRVTTADDRTHPWRALRVPPG
jgi:hypothetical protein